MRISGNTNYKPDEKDCMMFLNDTSKSGYTDNRGMMIMLAHEYPTLTTKEVEKYMKKWLENKKKK